MLHARDSFLKHFAAQLGATGWPLNTVANRPLQPNQVTVTFLTSTPRVTANPSILELVFSIDCLAEGNAENTADRLVFVMAKDVDRALSGGWVAKQDWSNPSALIDLGTAISWRPWGSWRRVPDPSEQYAHLNRTFSLLYIGERV